MTYTYKSKITKQKKSSGFTLVELMIVVAIVGILASIAYPSYTRYVQKSKRTEAMVALMQAAQVQEKFYSQNLKYAYNPATLYNDATLGATFDTENALYAIDVDGFQDAAQSTAATAVANPCISYTIKATAKGSQLNDLTCRVLTITNTGVKASQRWDSATSALVANPQGTCW